MTDNRLTSIELASDPETTASILFVEPFYGGSHKQLIDLLSENIHGCKVYTMPAKKWHWRMRTSALYFAQNIAKKHLFRIIFASSVLNLAELVALRPDLASLRKILYFHENQLVYPVRKQQERDFQYGYNQILSCLVADMVLFNSHFNMTSFLDSINSFLKLMPDFRPKDIPNEIKSKSRVLYFPITLIDKVMLRHDHSDQDERRPLHIVWPHRWEHDKGPETFFNVLFQLEELGVSFQLSVIGQCFQDVPDIFHEAKERLQKHLINWGYQENREDYLKVLSHADVVVSTAKHEFFGVSMLEAVCCGCFPLCPKCLVYPEIFPEKCLYNTPHQLFKKLKQFITRPYMLRRKHFQIDIEKFGWRNLRKQYEKIFEIESKEI